jgi:dTDP-L-rhamnose 4-epimerase
MNVLITGGAGFIGTHLARRLVQECCCVTILDNFSLQVHGDHQALPEDLARHVRLIVGDIRDAAVVAQALAGQDVVVHLAAETGTGQSMYEVERYEDVNIKGTAILLEHLVNAPTRTVQKIIVASSRAIYGEGKYTCAQHGIVYPAMRAVADIQAGRFEPVCPHCGTASMHLPTDETARLDPSSFYGLTKQMQEQMTLLFAQALNISAFALRYQNVYGPGQSLKNPYTGILAIFSNQARLNQPIYIFEDGAESRDFVYIADVVEATWRCISAEGRHIEALNVGSGQQTTVKDVVAEIVSFFGSNSEVVVTGSFRVGDIRHNVADLTKIRRLLQFEPQWQFKDGIRQFLAWAQSETAMTTSYERSLNEMRRKGLLYG